MSVLLLSLLLVGAPTLAAAPPTAAAGWLPPAYSTGSSDSASVAPWWADWGDPGLDAAIRAGLGANPDLGALSAVTDAQRALASQSFSPVLPALSFDVQGQVAPTDTQTFGFGITLPEDPDAPDTYTTGSAAFNARLQVDLWGRSLSTWQAGRLDAMAAGGDRDAAALLLSASVAGAWLDAAAAARQVEIVERQQQLAAQLLEIVRLRYEGGSATALDLLQQEQNQAAVDAQLPLARAQLRLARQRLAVLTAQDPTGELPAPGSELPALPPEPALGSPLDLLDNRPDVRAAADRVDSARIRRSAAVRGLLPTLALSGSYGWKFYYETEWLDVDTWSAGASLSVPLFNGGATHAGIRQAGAARTAAERQLESALRSAVQEVEAAVETQARQAERAQASARQLDRAEAAWQVAREQYQAGSLDYLQAQSALLTLLSAQLSELQARRDLLGARIQLHQALGGAWTRDLDALR